MWGSSEFLSRNLNLEWRNIEIHAFYKSDCYWGLRSHFGFWLSKIWLFNFSFDLLEAQHSSFIWPCHCLLLVIKEHIIIQSINCLAHLISKCLKVIFIITIKMLVLSSNCRMLSTRFCFFCCGVPQSYLLEK